MCLETNAKCFRSFWLRNHVRNGGHVSTGTTVGLIVRPLFSLSTTARLDLTKFTKSATTLHTACGALLADRGVHYLCVTQAVMWCHVKARLTTRVK